MYGDKEYRGVAITGLTRSGFDMSVSDACFSPMTSVNALKVDVSTCNYRGDTFPRKHCSISRHT
jgi:hypothetical protein